MNHLTMFLTPSMKPYRGFSRSSFRLLHSGERKNEGPQKRFYVRRLPEIMSRMDF